jgi:hypothetical protein
MNEEIKQILRTTRLCAGSEPVTSTKRSCTPTNVSHSRGVLSKIKMLPIRDIICYRDKCTRHLSCLFESRRHSDQLSTVHFVRLLLSSLDASHLTSQWVTSFLTDGGRHKALHLAWCALRARTANLQSWVAFRRDVPFLSLKVMLQLNRVSAPWGGEHREETGFKQVIKLPLYEISALISDTEK